MCTNIKLVAPRAIRPVMLLSLACMGLLGCSQTSPERETDRIGNPYSGETLIQECVLGPDRYSMQCQFSLDVELTALMLMQGIDCVSRSGVEDADDLRRLLKNYVRSSDGWQDEERLTTEAFKTVRDPVFCERKKSKAELSAEEELRELRQAATRGDIEAQVAVGIRTFGAEQRYWLCMAANNGSSSGQYEYGRILESYDSNHTQAYVWYRRAERGGYYLARDARAQVEKRLDADDITRLEQQTGPLNPGSCITPMSH